jgi:hypothetical protein
LYVCHATQKRWDRASNAGSIQQIFSFSFAWFSNGPPEPKAFC